MTTITAAPAVANWLWTGDDVAPVAGLDLTDARGPRAFGQFALHQVDPSGRHWFARDPLGVNKLFFAIANGQVEWSNYWIDLVRRGRRGDAVWSVPSGHRLAIDAESGAVTLERLVTIPFAHRAEPMETVVARIQQRLELTFRRLRAAIAGRPLYVTLSGGLDSTAIAVLAREWLGPFTAVTFAVDNRGRRSAADSAGEALSDDFEAARRVARDLGVALRPVLATPDDLLGLVDTVLDYGQDWRDFNVHCGVVNAALGQAIGRDVHAVRPVLLTGDVMNELMADYTPVTYAGRAYYPLPDVAPGHLRRFLVQGLDAGDREVGIFAHFGLDAIQPYALCADAYAAVPGDLLAGPEAKQQIVARVMGARIPSYIYDRRKTRAQVGSAETGGTLALFADRGLDAAYLRQRFAARFDLDSTDLDRMIRGGMYRFPSSGQVVAAGSLPRGPSRA